MLKTICKEIINKNTFLFHFIDKNSYKITDDQSNKINQYKTDEDNEIKVAIRVSAIPPAISIDLKIKYPPNFYNPNYYELLNVNEKWFQDFYNEIMYYNQTVDFDETINSKEYIKAISK